jgi:hypothetical protein
MIKSRRITWVEHVACIGEMINAYSILVRKPEIKGALRGPRLR